MAQRNTMISRLASAGEEALSKLSENPAAHKALQSVTGMKDRLDDVSKRVRGLEAMEKRIAKLERRLDKLDKPAAKRKPAAAKKKPATKKT